MHILLKQPPETTIEIVHEGKTYAVRFEAGVAYVPRQLGLAMIRERLVTQGELNDPPPRWERLPGGGHGRELGMFDPWVTIKTKETV